MRLNRERKEKNNNENQAGHLAGLSKPELEEPIPCQTEHPLQPMHQPIYPQAEKPIETPLLVHEQSSEHNTFFGIFGFIASVIALVVEFSGFVSILCALALLMAIVILAACATQAIMVNATPSARPLTFQQ
jgi:hypothetical protein